MDCRGAVEVRVGLELLATSGDESDTAGVADSDTIGVAAAAAVTDACWF